MLHTYRFTCPFKFQDMMQVLALLHTDACQLLQLPSCILSMEGLAFSRIGTHFAQWTHVDARVAEHNRKCNFLLPALLKFRIQ